jgi:hypothetical protein
MIEFQYLLANALPGRSQHKEPKQYPLMRDLSYQISTGAPNSFFEFWNRRSVCF